MKSVTQILPPTSTFAQRVAIWNETAPGVGVLIIQEKYTAGSKIVGSRYSVLELPTGSVHRTFKLAKARRRVVPGALYYVQLRATAESDLCNCEGFVNQGHCKHAQALRALAPHIASLHAIQSPPEETGQSPEKV
jgi:hypothetical protein